MPEELDRPATPPLRNVVAMMHVASVLRASAFQAPFGLEGQHRLARE